MTLRTCLRREARLFTAQENDGVAAVEFAIYGTVFLMIVAATVDIGLALFTQSELDAAVSAGAQYAANSAALVADPTLNTNISDIVNNANGTSWATSTVNVNNGNAALIAIARPARPAVGPGAAQSPAAAPARAAVSAANLSR